MLHIVKTSINASNVNRMFVTYKLIKTLIELLNMIQISNVLGQSL